MELLIIIISILQSVGVSLGVGSSTLAVTNFFVAIADGKIDDSERKMMGVVYIVLRIAMVLILLTSASLGILSYIQSGTYGITTFIVGFWILIFVLFLNAVLMTKHILPPTLGPAIQASSWYTMGILMALSTLGLIHFSFANFMFGYFIVFLVALITITGVFNLLKHSK